MNQKMNAYEQVEAELATRITAGFYSQAQKLPSEYDLAKEFGVSRITVRKAIDELIKKNKLLKQKGKGTFIIPQDKIPSGSQGLQGFTEVAQARGLTPRTQLVEFSPKQKPSEAVRASLQLDEREAVHIIKRLRLADNEPLIIEELTIPVKYLANVSERELEEQSIFSLIEQTIPIGYSHQEVSAELIDEEQADLLQVAQNQPVLRVNSLVYSHTSTPIYEENSYYRADRYTFKNILRRQS